MTPPPGLGIVTARGGSKRLPRKNLRTVHGETLVALAVRSGLESGCCERVICSTDDTEIAASARAAGAEVLMRPGNLASDDATSQAVVRHVLESFEFSWPWFVLLQPTSPLRTGAHVRNAVTLLTDGVDAVVSVAPARVHPFKHLYADSGGRPMPVRTFEDLSTPWQRLPQAWHPNGAVYVCRTESFWRYGSFFAPAFRILEMDDASSIDVDTTADLEEARQAAGDPELA